MAAFISLIRHNRNYRRMWAGQVVSEIGDYFNNVAVFALAMQITGSGLVVSGVMLARAFPAMLAGPIAGVALDRFDRKRIMIASDLFRSVVALGFLLALGEGRTWLLYALSALLMFASPFFTSGRTAVLPTIAGGDELHTANSLTRTTEWATLTLGAMLAGLVVAKLGFAWAFIINSASFMVSAAAISRMAMGAGGFRARRVVPQAQVIRPWQEYKNGLRYIASVPMILGIALLHVGWAAGGGAAQVLFALFGEQVFGRGAAGIGTIWGFAGIGLLIGGPIGHVLGKRVGYEGYKHAISISYFVHGAAYVAFSQMHLYWAALLFIALSRVGMAVTSVLNYSQLLRHTPDEYRGRVFSTMESLRWATMMISMALAGFASEYYSPRAIGVVAGALGSVTALAWAWANRRGWLPEPPPSGAKTAGRQRSHRTTY